MRVLKKYANRKIYDSEDRRYVTIKDIRDMIQAKKKIQVVDEKSGEDITRKVLIQILSDLEDSVHPTVLTDYVLQYMIRMYGNSRSNAFAMYMDFSLRNFLKHQDNLSRKLDSMMQNTQSQNIKDFSNQVIDVLGKAKEKVEKVGRKSTSLRKMSRSDKAKRHS